MSNRKIAIRKQGNSTIVDIKANGTDISKTITYNKKTNLQILNNVLHVNCDGYPVLFITFDQLEDDLGVSTLEDWNTAAAALFFFSSNVNGGGSSSGGSGGIYSNDFNWEDPNPQTFTIPANTTVALVIVNRIPLLASEYTFVAPTLTIINTLENPSIITVLGFTTI